MSKHDHLAPPPPPRRERRTWTRAEDYLPNRRRRRSAPRKDIGERPEAASRARPFLGMVPFMLLMFALAVLAVAIMVAAYPGQVHSAKAPQPVREDGTAAPGWLVEPSE